MTTPHQIIVEGGATANALRVQELEKRLAEAEAKLKESQAENGKLKDCLEPGKASAINAGMFKAAERLGLPHSSVKHALTLLEDEIVSLRNRLKESEALAKVSATEALKEKEEK